MTADRTGETRCEVIAADPGRAFGRSVTAGNVHCPYTMEPADEGTLLTESREFTAKGQAFFAERFGARAEAEIAQRHATARDGIRQTLGALRRIVDGPA